MADWTASPPDLAPGPVEPAPNPIDPGWARFLNRYVENPLDDDPWTNPKPTLTGVALEVVGKKRERVLVEGENPGNWFADKKIEVGEGENYNDYTRYRRSFPSITFKWYMRYEIRWIATYSDGTIVRDTSMSYWVEIPGQQNQTARNFTITRWLHSSRFKRMPDGSEGKEEDLVPPGAWRSFKEPWPSDLDPPGDIPPRDVMPRVRRVSMIDPFDERREHYAFSNKKRYVGRISIEEVGDVDFVDAKVFAKVVG